MSSWDQLAVKVCKDRGLELLSLVSNGLFYAVKNEEGRTFPLSEAKLTAWVQEEQAKEKANDSK